MQQIEEKCVLTWKLNLLNVVQRHRNLVVLSIHLLNCLT